MYCFLIKQKYAKVNVITDVIRLASVAPRTLQRNTTTNRIPVREYYGVIIPDYVNITYSCIIFTDYVEQMNKIVEGINFASDSYWGDPNKFKFRAMIDNYTTAVELNKGEDRAVKTNFNINLFGHIITDAINAKALATPKFSSKSSVNFTTETVKSIEELQKVLLNGLINNHYLFVRHLK